MKDTISDKPWRDFLPDNFHWLKKVAIHTYSESIKDNTNIILCRALENDHDDFTIDASHIEQIDSNQVKSHLKNLFWTPKSGIITLTVNDQRYIAVPVTKMKISPQRKARQVGIDLATYLKKFSLEKFVIHPSNEYKAIDILDGVFQGFYQQNAFKKDAPHPKNLPSSIQLQCKEVTNAEIDKLRILCQSISLTRMLDDAPANWLTPERFAEIAHDISHELNIKCTIKNRNEIKDLGMGCFYSVAKGSPFDPKLIVMEINGQNNNQIALVGKGLTFDTGGSNLKPSANMTDMKYDMCGGAAVLGSAFFFGHYQPPSQVICAIGAVENTSGGWASRPGDIVKSINGKTVEILNTDAEGRLVLVDVIGYLKKNYDPKLIINIATLTGAVVMAFGSVGAAVMANNSDVSEFILQEAKNNGEPLWELPLWPEFQKEIKSDIADYKNIANTNVRAGSIIAGTFINEFVGDTPWAHLDVAGTSWDCMAAGYPKAGGSGFGVRTLISSCFHYET